MPVSELHREVAAIAPPKTDQERLLVISPEAADVPATILQRIRTPGGSVPLVVTYDRERVWNPPIPVLFQYQVGIENRPLTIGMIQVLLRGAFTGTSPAGDPVRFTHTTSGGFSRPRR